LTTETKYGGTVTDVKRKRVPGGGSSYSKTTRAKACVSDVNVVQRLSDFSLVLLLLLYTSAVCEQTLCVCVCVWINYVQSIVECKTLCGQ